MIYDDVKNLKDGDFKRLCGVTVEKKLDREPAGKGVKSERKAVHYLSGFFVFSRFAI